MPRAASNQQRLIADLLVTAPGARCRRAGTGAPLVADDLVPETLADLASGTDVGVAFADGSDGGTVSTDAEWLRRVVTSLASNAWKYGGTTIDVHVRRGDGTVRVEVTDDGEGIGAEDVPRLFQRSSRLVPDGATSASGTGLGLYVCKQLIEAHDGRIVVESEAGVGRASGSSCPRRSCRPPCRSVDPGRTARCGRAQSSGWSPGSVGTTTW